MKVSGFTIVRNAIRFDYPVEESIRSILPLCDEVVVAVGQSDDNTRKLIESIAPDRIRILDTVWDENLRSGGTVLAEETNKALEGVSPDADWAFYIQADEVVHEDSLDIIRNEMERWLNYRQVEGLLLRYRHFWGSYQWIGHSRKWYRNEIRIIRPHIGISSYKDAQGFRFGERKVRVKPVDAWIHHYGWVRPPSAQQAKQLDFHRYWHDEEWIRKNINPESGFDYTILNSLRRYTGTHPAIMAPRIARQDWDFHPSSQAKPLSIRHRLLDLIEERTGWRIGEYRNYRLI